jgi:hypothetical protein
MLNGIVRPGIQFLVYVPGKVFAQMHIVTVAAKAFPVVWLNFNGAFSYFF